MSISFSREVRYASSHEIHLQIRASVAQCPFENPAAKKAAYSSRAATRTGTLADCGASFKSFAIRLLALTRAAHAPERGDAELIEPLRNLLHCGALSRASCDASVGACPN